MGRLVFDLVLAAALVVVLILLASCGPRTYDQGAYTVCNLYESTLSTLADYREAGKLDANEVATVNKWRPKLNKACAQGEAPEAQDWSPALAGGLRELIAIAEGHQ